MRYMYEYKFFFSYVRTSQVKSSQQHQSPDTLSHLHVFIIVKSDFHLAKVFTYSVCIASNYVICIKM